MAEFYHVDRDPKKFLTAGFEMVLRKPKYEGDPEYVALYEETYPDGLGVMGDALIRGKLPETSWVFAREKTLETVRIQNYPHLPSRLTSVFACESVEDADRLRRSFFADGHDWSHARIWRVECESWLKRDMNIFAFWGNSQLIKSAHAYWQDQVTSKPFFELLLKPPVRLLDVVIYDPEITPESNPDNTRVHKPDDDCMCGFRWCPSATWHMAAVVARCGQGTPG